MIRFESVSKRFGKTVALDGVSFSVARGEVVGFVGPNGAGKTTALRILCGFLATDAGRCLVAGHDVASERARAVGRIGYLPESAPLYRDMRVEAYLRFRARLKGVARGEVAERVDIACGRAGLGDVRRKVIGTLSKGYRQRVGLADALIAAPPVLVLDEPTSGLDPVQLRAMRKLLAELAGEHTILLSSHALGEIETGADRVVVLAGGRVVADGTPPALREAAGLPGSASLEDVFVALTAVPETDAEREASA